MRRVAPRRAVPGVSGGFRARQGLSSEQVEVLWRRQGGTCPCGEPLGLLYDVDHDREAPYHGHDPRRGCPRCARALMHHGCNSAIAFAKHDSSKLRRLADYVEATGR